MSNKLSFLNDRIKLHCGDCLEVLPTLAENSVDSCVTDPPYHLTSIVKRFGAKNSAPCKVGKTGAYARASAGFMGKQWDGGDIAFRPETWAAVYRVLKPGGHLIAFGGTRTYHRMACAIEDAGFEIRDQIQWLYGSGFPKSHDVSKGIDRIEGMEDQRVITHYKGQGPRSMFDGGKPRPASLPASLWNGWGTALKPACEPIVLARKPLSEPTVAANVLKWGTGVLNIDGCRVLSSAADQVYMAERINGFNNTRSIGGDGILGGGETMDRGAAFDASKGRWPANVIHDGSEEVVGAFPDVHGAGHQRDAIRECEPTGVIILARAGDGHRIGDAGGTASRFFYTAKADSDDRLGSKRPTVKPLDLMQYLVRLVTLPKGIVLDCFAGTGTTGEAAWREGFNAVLIEREAEYQADIRRRMRLALSGPAEREFEAMKARNKGKPADQSGLFSDRYR